MSVLAALVFAILPASLSAATTIIGPEAQVPLPSSAKFSLFAGNAPDDGSVQTINPPIFKWLYFNDPWTIGSPNTQVQTFRFQLSTDPNFSTTVWNIVTSNNFYNCLAPITNANGSIFTGTCYWRVIYMDGSLNVIKTGSTYTFTLAPNATPWDRSFYGTTNFTMGFGSQHPHMFFTAGNRASMASFLHTNASPGFSWLQVTQICAQAISSPWWNNDSFTNQNPANLGEYVAYACLAYQIDSNAVLKAANPGQMVSRLASAFMAYGYDRFDQNALSEGSKVIPLCYDWAYDDMTPNQRSNVLYTIEKFSQFFINEDWWYVGTAASPDRSYANPLKSYYFSAGKTGADHPSVDSGLGLFMAMGGMGESALLRDHLTYYLNYAIGHVEPFHADQGRGYAEQSFRTLHAFSAQLLLACLDARMTNNPWFIKYPKMLAYWEPLNYCELQSQYGDFGMAPQNGVATTGIYDYKYLNIAMMLQNGAILRQQRRNFTVRTGTPEFIPEYGQAFLPYYFPTLPTEKDWPDSYYFDAHDGWCMSYSYPPNNWNCFTNGVGFILTARPSGAANGHGGWHDGSVQLWAYGAQVSCGGIGSYYKHAIFDPGLFIDGIGNCTPNGQYPTAEWYSRLTAFTNTPDFTYVGSDLSQAYNNSNYNSFAGGGLGNLEYNYNYPTNRRPYIVNVQRHVVFPHKKYIVLYDSFKTTTNATFQWKWNIMEKTSVVDSNNFLIRYTSTNFFNGSNVTVFVKHIVDPTKMSMMNLVGTNWAVINPFTDEDLTTQAASLVNGPRFNSTIWVYNKTKATNWHFLSVVFPVKWGQPAPTITRVDDYTVHVTQDGNDDEIHVDPTTDPPTFSLNLTGPALGGSRLSPPGAPLVSPQ